MKIESYIKSWSFILLMVFIFHSSCVLNEAQEKQAKAQSIDDDDTDIDNIAVDDELPDDLGADETCEAITTNAPSVATANTANLTLHEGTEIALDYSHFESDIFFFSSSTTVEELQIKLSDPNTAGTIALDGFNSFIHFTEENELELSYECPCTITVNSPYSTTNGSVFSGSISNCVLGGITMGTGFALPISFNFNRTQNSADAFETDNDFSDVEAGAGITIDGGPENRTIHTTSDEDYILVKVPALANYDITVTNVTLGLDLSLTLFDQDKSTILYHADFGGVNEGEFLSHSVIGQLGNQDYFLLIKSIDSTTGNYEIQVTTF